MSNATGRRVRFGRNSFEPATGRLWAEEVEVKLTRKSAEVLGLLVERAGHPVSKQDLFAAVWRNVIVGDDALTTCVQELRRALGDDARQPRYIETRHRYGYSFVAPVAPETTSPELAAIAVLPFTDMSPDRDQSYFCASAVVQGSVRKADEQLRITVQLVDAASGYHDWSRRFERAIGDVFEIQDEIAETVASSLRAALLPAATFRPADLPPPTADILPPGGAPESRDFAASPLPRTRTRNTARGNTLRLPVSLEACSLDA